MQLGKLQTILLIIACILILFGYLRFITDKNGRIDLDNYRFTGGIGIVLIGLIEGSRDLLRQQLTNKALSSLVIYCGILLFYISF
ncbi:MetJ regulator of methionine regulon [Psychromonas sp. RZ22]|uniref:MetJ regulator of methionine regulon n=1 Tax=Psychromonas algarum TaxID=2555643 RepID=UPI0010683E85|nr:MetJ regulator of methionine regulon [Psychromonas sp. RZ22]TEW55235.1 MetJ regulator of methionine regulon [Psychromonas sp. RZ22]